MKKLSAKLLNAAFWIEMMLCYLLPFRVEEGLRYSVGFPISFITVYDTEIGINPLMSMHLNPLGLLFNVAVIYFILSACTKAYDKCKRTA